MDGEETDTMRRLLYILMVLPMMVHAEHLFEMGIHGGVAGWSSKTVYVNKQVGFQGGAQVYYNYLSPYVIGFRTGLTLDCHQAGFAKTNYEDHYATIDVDNQRMEIDYTIGRLTERYTSWSVGVPLQVAFSYDKFLFLVGAKAVFPMSTSWKQKAAHTALSVYYPDYNNRVEESFPLAASRDFTMTNSGKTDLPKVQWWLATELSYRIPLHTWSRNHRSYLIVGAYFDYCFTQYSPVHSSAESMIMLSDTRDGFPLHRLLTPVMEATRQGRQLVSQCALFDVGIKLSYALSPYDRETRQKSFPCRCLPFSR